MKGINKYKKEEYKYILPLIVAFVMPLSRSLSAAAIIIWIIGLILLNDWKVTVKNLFLFIPSSLWIFQFFRGIFTGANIFSIGLDSTLSLLLIPLLFYFTLPLESRSINRILNAFLLGTLCAIAWTTAFTGWNLITTDWTVTFKVLKHFIKLPFHHAYFSLFLNTSLYLVLWRKELGFKTAINPYIMISIIILALAMISSRSGFVVLAVILVIRLFFKGSVFRIFSLALISIYFLGFLLMPFIGDRIFDSGIYLSLSDVELRLNIWKILFSAMRENHWHALGIDNIQQVISDGLAVMKLNDYAGIDYNAHNQFLQYYSEMGIAGLFVFLAVLALPLIKYREKAFLHLQFLVAIIVIYSSFESILERQFGVMFFSYFYSLFIMMGSLEKDNKSIEKK